ncbi:hypothetical protein AgCh_027849 [Apium graveolens]
MAFYADKRNSNFGNFRLNYKPGKSANKPFGGVNSNTGNNTKKFNKPRSNYFCTYCKISGHINESLVNNIAQSENKETSHIPIDQYNHLIKLLTAQKIQMHGYSHRHRPILIGNLRNGLYVVDQKDLLTTASSISKYYLSAI